MPSPTSTGKIEWLHRTLRAEFDTQQVFRTLRIAQQTLDEWVSDYNTERQHSSLGDATPASRFTASTPHPASRPRDPGRTKTNGSPATSLAIWGLECERLADQGPE